MKVNELLLEKTLIKKKWRADKVTVSEAIKLLNNNCKSSLTDIAKGVILWRGMRGVGKVAALDSTEAYRTSRDTNNLYQLGMEASSNMKGVPPRSKSFICTTDYTTADNYGQLYTMFPYDDTPVAGLDTDDIFDIDLKYVTDGVQGFSSMMENTLATFNINPDQGDKFTSINKLDRALAAFDSHVVFFILCKHLYLFPPSFLPQDVADEYNKTAKVKIRMTTSWVNQLLRLHDSGKLDTTIFASSVDKVLSASRAYLSTIRDAMVDNPKNKFTALSSLIFSPDDLEITLTKPGALSQIDGDAECWFSGKCIAINVPLFIEIILEMHKQKIKVGKDLLDFAQERAPDYED